MFRADYNVTESFFNVYYYLLMKMKYRSRTLTYKYFNFDSISRLIDLFTAKDMSKLPKSICINNNNGNDILLMSKME